MSEHKPGDEQHRHQSALLHAQEHKGYDDDEASASSCLTATPTRGRPRRRRQPRVLLEKKQR
jgi:hypothetical protein